MSSGVFVNFCATFSYDILPFAFSYRLLVRHVMFFACSVEALLKRHKMLFTPKGKAINKPKMSNSFYYVSPFPKRIVWTSEYQI